MGEPDQTFDAKTRGQAWTREEIDAAIAGLDRATERLSNRVNSMQQAARTVPHAHEPTSQQPLGSKPAGEVEPPPPRRELFMAASPAAPEQSFDDRMRDAEREARMYLERAKHRADQLVNSMIGAVEEEATEIRREAEEGIRERWRAVEEEAGRYLEDARGVADNMVGERQRQIGAISDEIVGGAQSLTAGMEDAERVRRQFDDFVRALSRTADQIARAPSRGATDLPGLRNGKESSQGDAVAA